MIEFDRFTLDNGLKVIVHHDASTPIVAVNILYNVGAKDEDPELTGFAHLFEHLMFGGSTNIPIYDEPLEHAGGSNNAFTSNDITNYYLTLPKQNLETAFWLESDRMVNLNLSAKSIKVQKQVVIEEFKQRYLNQPYGDVWLLLRPLVYKVHPYQWPTIGKDIHHIEKAKAEEVRSFYAKHYCPGKAILTVSGDVSTEQIRLLSEKWFGPVQKQSDYVRSLPVEPVQTSSRELTVTRDVPYHGIYKAFHIPGRKSKDFYAWDLLSDILSGGDSSRLYRELVIKQQLFSEIQAFLSGDLETGLFLITGKVFENVSIEEAESGLWKELDKIKNEGVSETEIQKVCNKVEMLIKYGEIKVLDKAMNLSYFELLGDAAFINEEVSDYRSVNNEQIKKLASQTLIMEKCSTLYYRSKNLDS